MKVVLTIILFLTLGLTYIQSKQQPSINLTTFKNVPDDMSGCAEDCYLNKGDRKKDRLICYTDYGEALVHLNNKSLRLGVNENIRHSKNEEVFTTGQYTLILKKTYKKQTGDEDYQFQGVLTIKLGKKVLFQQIVIGEGGC